MTDKVYELTEKDFYFSEYIRTNALKKISHITRYYRLSCKEPRYKLEFEFIAQMALQPAHFRCDGDDALLATMIRIYSVASEIWNEPMHKIINEVRRVLDIFIELDEKYKTIINFYEPIWERCQAHAKYRYDKYDR